MKSKLITWKGKSQKLARWAKELDISLKVLWYRLNAGWSVDMAFSTPVDYSKKQEGSCKNHPDRPARTRGLCGSCYNRYLDDRCPIEKKKKLQRRSETNAIRYAKRDKDIYSRKQRSRMLKHRYGIDSNRYDEMLEEQDYKCAICKTEEHSHERKLYVDHNHKTGKVRALLCAGCNTAVGIIEKGTDFTNFIIKYLKETE